MRADAAATASPAVTTVALFSNWIADPIRAADPADRVIDVQGATDLALAADAECAMGWPQSAERLRALVASARRLRWVHTFSAGVDRFLVPEIIARDGLILTNNTGAYDVPIAEHVLAMIFATSKRLPEHLAAQARHEWQKDAGHREVRDARLVILGLGSIGTELARLAAGLGMHVVAVRRDASRPAPGVERILPPARLAEAVRDADYLAVTAALTSTTRGMVSAQILAAMRPTAWLINIARGPIVHEAALIAALRERRIAGAALDVFDTEPLPPSSPLWALDNVILTPHVSNSSPRVRDRTLSLALENLRRFKANEPLLNVVDKQAGY